MSVRHSVGKTAVVLLAAGLCVLAAPAVAPAQIAFTPCSGSTEFACGHLTVPLDPTGAVAGAVTLAIRRHRAPVGEERSAVIALAGGPGQAALPFTEQFVSVLGPIIATRDLIIFDQRGTGDSHRLSCRPLEASSSAGPGGQAVTECARQLGPAADLYTTPDSVADIEAIRVAGGYEKLVLYGTSYGTKLAEEYAQAYPSHVEALVLDSVVAPNGPDPLNRATFAAIPRVLLELCARHACAHITTDPLRDLAVLVARLGARGRRARWIDGHGHGHEIDISSEALLEALLAGDLEPTLRAEFPAAVHSAARGDMAALARLLERARSSEMEAESPGEGFDTPLYFATTCEDSPFAWNRAAAPGVRLAEAQAQIHALGARPFSPFTDADVLALSDIPACAFWPLTGPEPALQDAPFPHVPTLILSGADDLRTPTATAAEVAAQIPGSKLLVVPNVGHSVLAADPTSCSHDALQALFTGGPIKPCPSTPVPALLAPTPLPPARLADVAPAPGNSGKPGRTLEAALLTIDDAVHQVAVQALAIEEQASASSSASAISTVNVGGLRSGWAELAAGKLLLHGYSYVPGVTVSGEITNESVELTVGGSAAAHGTLLADHGSSGPERTLTGMLEGSEVRLGSALRSELDTRAAITARRCVRAGTCR